MSGGKPCLVCGNGLQESRRYPALARCPSCGFLTTPRDYPRAELQKLYGKSYFFGEEYRDYVSERDSLRENFRRRLRELWAQHPLPADARALEIGCAYGFFLELAKPHFSEITGIDISPDAVEHARRLGASASPEDYLDYRPAGPLDAIFLWDTIEHLGEPRAYLEKAARELGSGGALVITTGDLGSWNARFRGKRWRLIHPPTHLHYFSAANLRKLLDMLGFDVVRISHPGHSRTLRSILHHFLVQRWGWEAAYRRIAGWKIWDGSITLNLFDLMFVIARKRR